MIGLPLMGRPDFFCSRREEDGVDVNPEDRRFTNAEAAEYLGICTRALKMWRDDGKGPRAIKLGRRYYFRKKELDAFIEQQLEPMPQPVDVSR